MLNAKARLQLCSPTSTLPSNKKVYSETATPGKKKTNNCNQLLAFVVFFSRGLLIARPLAQAATSHNRSDFAIAAVSDG
jgi:hypothetical protein